MDTKNDKQQLRDSFLAKRDALPIGEKREFDKAINQTLIQLIDNSNYRDVHVFLPMRSEPNIYPFINYLLEKKIRVSCPKSLVGGLMENYILKSTQELSKGIFGTTYPANSERSDDIYDLIVVPGLAYSKQNERLGYGGGYYDRFLTQQQTALKLAPAYKFQVVESLPSETHDIKMDRVFTP